MTFACATRSRYSTRSYLRPTPASTPASGSSVSSSSIGPSADASPIRTEARPPPTHGSSSLSTTCRRAPPPGIIMARLTKNNNETLPLQQACNGVTGMLSLPQQYYSPPSTLKRGTLTGIIAPLHRRCLPRISLLLRKGSSRYQLSTGEPFPPVLCYLSHLYFNPSSTWKRGTHDGLLPFFFLPSS